MTSLKRAIAAIGGVTLSVVVLAPLLAAGLTAHLADGLVEPNRQAAAAVPISYISGSYASYESKTFATDFGMTNYMGETGAKAAAAAAGIDPKGARSALQASQQGDATTVDVTFTAPSAKAAEAGLRAAVKASMVNVLQTRIQRLKIDHQGAEDQRAELAAQVAAPEKLIPANLSPEARTAWLDSQKLVLDKVTQQSAQTAIQVSAASAALAGVPDIVAGLPVTVTELSTQADKIRMIATAGLSALVLVIALASAARLINRARRAKGEGAGTDAGPHSPAVHEVIPAGAPGAAVADAGERAAAPGSRPGGAAGPRPAGAVLASPAGRPPARVDADA